MEKGGNSRKDFSSQHVFLTYNRHRVAWPFPCGNRIPSDSLSCRVLRPELRAPGASLLPHYISQATQSPPITGKYFRVLWPCLQSTIYHVPHARFYTYQCFLCDKTIFEVLSNTRNFVVFFHLPPSILNTFFINVIYESETFLNYLIFFFIMKICVAFFILIIMSIS